MAPSTAIVGNFGVETIQVDTAPIAMVRKPKRADASPASFPNGVMVKAVPSGLATPIPHRKSTIDNEYQPKLGLLGPISSNAPAVHAVARPDKVMARLPQR